MISKCDNRVSRDAYRVKRFGFVIASSRIAVDLNLNQFLDRMGAIADDGGGIPGSGCDQFLANHQQAVF